MIEQRTLGRLTLEKDSGDLLTVRCSCGYPLVVSLEMWEQGEVLGCAVCDPLERADRKAEADEEAQARRRELAAKEDEAKRFAKYVDPHMEDVSAVGLKLLRALGVRPINLQGVMDILDRDKPRQQLRGGRQIIIHPTTKEQAWDALTNLIACNLVLEYTAPDKKVRPYNEWEYYSAQCLPSSSYGYRHATKRLLEELDQAAAEEKAKKLQAVKTGQVKEHLREWITAKCTVAPSASASRILLMDSYVKWAKSEGKEPLDSADYNYHMAEAGFKLGENKWSGVRLKTVQESLDFQRVADLPLAVDLTAIPPIETGTELAFHN